MWILLKETAKYCNKKISTHLSLLFLATEAVAMPYAQKHKKEYVPYLTGTRPSVIFCKSKMRPFGREENITFVRVKPFKEPPRTGFPYPIYIMRIIF